MNLRDLEYVVAVADHGHFGRAAAACNVSQPTLSGQILKLEEEIGAPLFERLRSGVRLTPAGETLLRHAREQPAPEGSELAVVYLFYSTDKGRICALRDADPAFLELVRGPVVTA